MPLFRKQSVTAKKRLQHLQYLAKESPEKTYDISACEITDIPSGTYSICKVLQKEALIAHSNWLSSLKGGGHLHDLNSLRVLDLHNNELISLPEEIGQLRSLQVLNLESNKLKHLPQSISHMTSLQILNVQDNKLKDIPEGVKEMKHLHSLNLSNNNITRLPKQLCLARALECLFIDSELMEFPPADVCVQGTEQIMKFLCSECGEEYQPPSKYVGEELDGKTSPLKHGGKIYQDQTDSITEKLLKYELAKETRKHDMMLLEQQFEEDNRLRAKLAAESAKNKKHLLEYVAQDQERFHDEMVTLQTQKENERKKLLQKLHDAEQTASHIIDHLLHENEKAKHSEAILEKLEKERIESEEWFKVRQEEERMIRKKDVLAAMQKMLASGDSLNQLMQHYSRNKDNMARKLHESKLSDDNRLESALQYRDKEQHNLVERLLHEEQLQKEAYIILQLEKDSKHHRITSQISMIHTQLAQLSAIEREHRTGREQIRKNVLEERRLALTDLLIQLMKDQDNRAQELHKQMLEMEKQREDNQTDYWLVQYQRLMDKKPQNLIDKEKKLEYSVVEILQAAQAMQYTHVFAYHRITIETLLGLTDYDLKQMNINEVGIRKAILREIESYKQTQEEKVTAKEKKIDMPFENEWQLMLPKPDSKKLSPTAPDKLPVSPSSPPLDVVMRVVDSECVICMDRLSSMLFLNCGHVCSCQQCAESLLECPMCRGQIIQSVLLS